MTPIVDARDDEDWTYTWDRYDTEDETIQAHGRPPPPTGTWSGGSRGGWSGARRALGNRSILADPSRADMRDLINLKIKFRERFRPFAPSVVEEALHDYFEDAAPAPFMQQVYQVRKDKRDSLPAITHVDGSGRIQTVSARQNPTYHALITAFGERSGIPILLNTSFNENEPIVDTPEQALDCFMRTRMDVVVIGNTVIRRHPVEEMAVVEGRND